MDAGHEIELVMSQKHYREHLLNVPVLGHDGAAVDILSPSGYWLQ